MVNERRLVAGDEDCGGDEEGEGNVTQAVFAICTYESHRRYLMGEAAGE